MLSHALTPRSPTWPQSDMLPLGFKAQVSSLQSSSQLLGRSIGLSAANSPQQRQRQMSLQRRLEAEAELRLEKGKPAAPTLLELDAPTHQLQADHEADGDAYDDGFQKGVVVAGPAAKAAEPPPTDARNVLVLLGGALVGLRSSDSLPIADQHARALQAIQLHAPLAHSLGLGSAFTELEELSYSRLFPESLRSLRVWYMARWPDAQSLVPDLVGMIEGTINAAPSLEGLLAGLSVTGRVKTVTSTFRKLLRDDTAAAAAAGGGGQGRRIDDVRDTVALRIVLTPAADATSVLRSMSAERGHDRGTLTDAEVEALVCFGVYRVLLSMWTEEEGRFKDFVTRPKANGYQSLHTNLLLPDGRGFEVQIRTAAMHERAESGSAAHNAYRAAQLGAAPPPRLLMPAPSTSRTTSKEETPLAPPPKVLPEAAMSSSSSS